MSTVPAGTRSPGRVTGGRPHARAFTPRRQRFPTVGWAGMGITAVFAVMAAAAPWLAGYGVNELAGNPLEPPSRAHLLGTTLIGQDVASIIVFGARTALFMAVVAGGATVTFGALVGMLAGWLGGRTDAVLMRVVDFFLVIPGLPLLVVLGSYVGPSTAGTAVIIAATAWPFSARIIRAQVLSLRHRAYLEASVGFGAPTAQVLKRHIVPEVGLVAAASLVGAAGRAVMMAAGLAFLGLGDPIAADWGRLMRSALDFRGLFFTDAWAWWLLPPVICIAVFLLGLTLLAVALEERVTPRVVRHVGMRGRRA